LIFLDRIRIPESFGAQRGGVWNAGCGQCQTGLIDGWSKIFGETKNIGYKSH